MIIVFKTFATKSKFEIYTTFKNKKNTSLVYNKNQNMCVTLSEGCRSCKKKQIAYSM